MKKILLCTGSQKNIDALSSLAESLTGAAVTAVMSAAGARKLIAESSGTDLVIINTPLKDEQGLELAVQMCETYCIPVLLITSQETAARSGDAIKTHGVDVMVRPADRRMLSAAVEAMLTAGAVMTRLKAQNAELRGKLDEIKLINRAKAMLIGNLNMTEAQAHRYIEKQAMDLRQSKKEIAMSVLRTYYNK